MTLAFQAAAVSALIAMILSSSGRLEDCVTHSAETIGVPGRAGEPVRHRVTLTNSCDRPLRIVTELTCAGVSRSVTRHVPAAGWISWNQTLTAEAPRCSFEAHPAGW